MTKEIFTLSENAKLEYSCTVVQIGEVKPVEGSDFLGSTLVNGNPIVVRKDQIKEGDIMIYAPIETVLNKKFLSVNNLFELSEREMNSNYKEVQALIDEGKKEARKADAEALYISACSSEETIVFYKAMGAELADCPIKEIAESEPYDLQMICSV